MTGELSWPDLSDAELVERVVHPGVPSYREAAFSAIYQRHAPAVLALCGGLIWDDFDSAQAAAQDAMIAAYRDLAVGRPPREPGKLRAWLLGIARNRCREEFRRRGRVDALPDDLEEDDWEAASRRRRGEVDRILGIVAASFTPPQQRIYELSMRQGLRGQALAAALGITEDKANDNTLQNISRLEQGFGAYILAREGRPFCPVLAGILDYSARDGQAFTRVLRLRILKHLDTCPTCGNCETCRVAKKKLVRPYAPALLPVLAGFRVRERVMSAVRGDSAAQPAQLPPSPPPPAPPPAGSSAPRSGASARPGLVRSGRGARRLRLPAVAGAAAVVPFVLALLVTRVAVAGSSPSGAAPPLQTVAAAMPAIAYGSGTSSWPAPSSRSIR